MQIDSLKRAASNSSTKLENNDQIWCVRILSRSDSCNTSATGPAVQGRSEVCGVLHAVKMMASITNMQSVHSFPLNCSVHEIEELEFYFYFFIITTFVLSVTCCMELLQLQRPKFALATIQGLEEHFICFGIQLQ